MTLTVAINTPNKAQPTETIDSIKNIMQIAVDNKNYFTMSSKNYFKILGVSFKRKLTVEKIPNTNKVELILNSPLSSLIRRQIIFAETPTLFIDGTNETVTTVIRHEELNIIIPQFKALYAEYTTQNKTESTPLLSQYAKETQTSLIYIFKVIYYLNMKLPYAKK